jgi:iron complex outermembrane receptor protein
MFFRSGLEFENAQGDGGNINGASRDDFTGYVLMHHEPWKKFMYNASLRAGVSSAYEVPIIYSLDARYVFTSSLSLRGAYSTNYRLPTFNDLYWEPGGNPELKPEFSSSGELGVEYQLKKINISAGWYFIKSQDLIQWRPVTQDFWSPVNIDNATNHGLEFMASYNHVIGNHLIALKASYDYTMATDDATNKQLIYVPQHRAGGILDYSWNKWNFNYNLQYVGKVFITTTNTESIDDYLLSDISFRRSICKDKLTLNFKVNNLFDVNYQSVAFRPMPGRNYVFQINFKL